MEVCFVYKIVTCTSAIFDLKFGVSYCHYYCFCFFFSVGVTFSVSFSVTVTVNEHLLILEFKVM